MEYSQKNLFQYLKSINIEINKNEFGFQCQSHPDYPSLLAISDTLSFFNVHNLAMKLSQEDIELLPNEFMCIIKFESKDRLAFVKKKKNDFYLYFDDATEIVDSNYFSQYWSGIILIAEKGKDFNSKKWKNYIWKSFFGLTFMVSCLYLLQFSFNNLPIILLSSIGMFLSVFSAKELFNIESNIVNKICNLNSNTDCQTVIKSKKWELFNFFSLSDLSIVFFASQFITLILFNYFYDFHNLIMIFKIISIFTLIIIFLSLYYQRFVEKKWCTICLLISFTLLLEFAFLLFIEETFYINVSHFLFYSVIFIIVYIAWLCIKFVLNSYNINKKELIKLNRFVRSYDNFKKILISEEKVFFKKPIITNNFNSSLTISIVTSPFCSFCKDLHLLLNKLNNAYEGKIKLNIYIKSNFDISNDKTRVFYRTLYDIYFKYGFEKFETHLNDWFVNQDIDLWFEINKDFIFDEDIYDNLIFEENLWLSENAYNFTPLIIINNYKYPSSYEREYLEYYINDLIEDSF